MVFCHYDSDMEKKTTGPTVTTKVPQHWLNFEGAYRRAGWKVEFDKPGYNESYPATFKFTAYK